MAHSYIEAFPDEDAAFVAFTADFPDRTTLLVDTYDTLGGVKAAIRAARRAGHAHLAGIRLDSGDLGTLAFQARRLLDEEGMTRTRIAASGGLDEYEIAELTATGAPIDFYGVGTRMGVSADAPYLDSAYKLVSYRDRPVMKVSAGKAIPPRCGLLNAAASRDARSGDPSRPSTTPASEPSATKPRHVIGSTPPWSASNGCTPVAK
jgi:nicotinate phosphoribosyltransferase